MNTQQLKNTTPGAAAALRHARPARPARPARLAAAALAALAACAAARADAVPEVSGVALSQGASSRLATIAYTLSGASAVVTVDVQTNAVVGGVETWASIGGENVQQMAGDVWKKVEPGARTISWRPDLSWPDHKIAEGGARAVVTAWSVDNPPDYLVVDLSATGGAGTERYYPAASFLPGGLLANPDYRTSKLVMRKIPAKGVEWTMGSDSTEPERDGSREAMHTVTIGDNYYIAVFETTQAQWGLVQTARAAPSYYNVERAMRPVEQVCYNEIRNAANSTTADTAYDYPADPNPKSFLGLLRTKTGLAFDLPSEAQWEFACRAGHGTGYWGDGSPILSSDKDANLARLGRAYYNGGKKLDADGKNYVDPGNGVGPTNGTAIVGSYAPNSWGLYDMHGNVWEWCLDWFEADITARGGAVNVDRSAPAQTLSGAAGSSRVRRGGSWYGDAGRCRAARRADYAPGTLNNAFGFRLALPVVASTP